MIYVFDIDGTICTSGESSSDDYTGSEPIRDRIDEVNKLYEQGHHIKFLTARGMGRTNNNREAAYALFYTLTYNQLKEWGVKFHELHLGKVESDYFIDDKGVNADDFFSK